MFGPTGYNSHIGNTRPHNEDSYTLDVELGLAVLADGMGGYEGGEIASRIVVECVEREVRQGTCMAESLVKAHKAVLAAAQNGDGRPGMGSTALALHVEDGYFEVVWVGDSRAYFWSGQTLVQLTTDHSLVQEMVELGEITSEEARHHPKRNYITQAIGMSELHNLKVGQVKGRVSQDQQILLCSDGLSGDVTTTEITEILAQELKEQQKVDLLIQRALDNGGSDNITTMLVSPLKISPTKPSESENSL